MSFILFTACFASVNAYGVGSSRRELLKQASFGVASLTFASTANAIDACPKGSKNCIVTTWNPPAGTSKKDMALAIRAAINGYPKEGECTQLLSFHSSKNYPTNLRNQDKKRSTLEDTKLFRMI